MNIEIKEIQLNDFNEFLIADPKLCYLGLCDQALDYLYHKKTVLLPEGSKLYGIYIEDILGCVIQSDFWSSICTIFHMYVSTTLQHTGLTRKIQALMRDHIRDNTSYRKALLYIPSPCEHVIMTAKAFGLKYEGTITNCMEWRQKTVDLVIYGLELYEEHK